MKILEVSKALSSPRRLEIISILSDKQLSAVNVYKLLKKTGKNYPRESVYRSLEILVDSGVLEKKYYQSSKEIKYSIKSRHLILDLLELNIKTGDNTNHG